MNDMIDPLNDLFISLGSILMVYNVYRYIKYLRFVQERGEWSSERFALYSPLVLIIFFLAGYIVVGIFGKPDLIMATILFLGSVYVAIMVFVLHRVTDKIQENERLQAELLASEESNRAKTSFLSNMSHEIRTPMNAIIGLDNIALKDPTIPPHTRTQLEKIHTSAEHLLDLINGILDMTRIESGKMELKKEAFSFPKLLDQVNVMIQGQCDEKGLNYVVSADDGLDGFFIGDSVKIRQILINILGNAVKFTPPKGTVYFTAEDMSQYSGNTSSSGFHSVSAGSTHPVRFTIRDTGIGMEKEFLAKIFDPFTQEDSTNTNRYGGSGLGLSLTKRYVDLMNGSITVESKKGVGSTFTLTLYLAPTSTVPADSGIPSANNALPADGAQTSVDATGAPAAPYAGGAASAKAAPATVPLQGKHILIAEDVEMNAEILADLLEFEGVTTEWVKDGQAAVDIFIENPSGHFDAVLMDMRMPVMDGLTAARTIRSLSRADAKTVPIIALTANTFEEDIRRSLDAGMNAHLSKPIEPELLYETLGHLIAEAERQAKMD
jgi:signal transduction histidine kinase/CheY-like chemotaxis protein